MWQSTIYTNASVQASLIAFLETKEFSNELNRQLNQNHEEPTVLDIVGVWLGYGENILAVPSFEELLVALVGLTDEWLLGDKKSVGGMPLWPHPTTGNAQVVSNFARPNDEAERDLDLEVGRSHSVLLRQNFEAHREGAIARQHARIENHLKQLARLYEDSTK